MADEPAEAARALEGLRVVDFGHFLAAPLATMILADNGADVVRVDPPGGPRWDHPVNAALQRGKRSIVLDLKEPRDLNAAMELIARADVVAEGFRPGVMNRLGLGAEAMTAADPRLVYCSLPGFAHDDPRAGLPAWEGILGAATGCYAPGHVTPAASKITEDLGITKGTGHRFVDLPFASVMGGLVATSSILAALIARERTGLGQAIEVPLFNAMFDLIGITGTKLPDATPGFPHPQRWLHAASYVNCGPCADGRGLDMVVALFRHYRWFAERFFPREWIEEGLGDPRRLLADGALAVKAKGRLLELIATKPSAEWEVLLHEAGVPATMCKTADEWLQDEHAHAIRAIVELDDPVLGATVQPGCAFSLSVTPPAARPRRPLGADGAQILAELGRPCVTPTPSGERPQLKNALEGIVVLDTTAVLAGPSSCRVLAELGADVIKINQPGYMISPWISGLASKRSLLLDLAKPEGKEVLWPLIEQADVFVQNMTRSTADRIGIGETEVRAHRPDIVYATMSAFHTDGPLGNGRGYATSGDARTGIMLRLGGVTPDFALCDYGAGELLAIGTLVALYHRVRTGQGQHVQSSLMHGGTYYQLPYMRRDEARGPWAEPAGQSAKGWGPLDRLYQTADGWLYLAAAGTGDAARIRGLTGVEPDDESALASAFLKKTLGHWLDRLADAGVAAHPSVNIESAMEDERTKALGLSLVRDHPLLGPVRTTGPAARLSRTPTRTFPAPLPGADTREILAAVGLEHRYDDLAAADIVADKLADDVVLELI